MSTVIEALRRFMPAYLSAKPVLSGVQRRAVWALESCRTQVMGGHVHECQTCPGERHYAYHSCHHKSCPQCGRAATAEWVRREQSKLIQAPYFMVTFTLPSELRELFFCQEAKAAYDAFFQASAVTLSQTLAEKKWLGAATSGFTMVLHTWNQKMLFHPHIHCIVPGAGLDEHGNYVVVKEADYLMPTDALKEVLKYHFGVQMKALGLSCDPSVWHKKWGVNVQAFGSGENAVKYLGRYIMRSVIGDSRILAISDTHVTFQYIDRSDRANPRTRTMTLSGIEFVRRYLRHVQPAKLRAVRYYGYHHPAAKTKRQRVQKGSGPAGNDLPAVATALQAGEARMTNDETKNSEPITENNLPKCPCCQQPMPRIARIFPGWKRRIVSQPQQSRAPPSEPNRGPQA